MEPSAALDYSEKDVDFEIKHLSAVDLKVAASILYNAYFDDPLFCKIFKVDEEGYEMRLRSAIREELNTFWEAKQPMLGVYRDGSLVAVTCLLTPNPDFGHGRYWHWRLRMLMTAGFLGTQQLLHKEKLVRSELPTEECHMISFIGVHPQHQDRGLGHILLAGINEVVSSTEGLKGVGVFVILISVCPFLHLVGLRLSKSYPQEI